MEAQIILNALYQTLIIFNGAGRQRDSDRCNESLAGLPDWLEAAAAPPQVCKSADTRRYEIASAETFNVGEITQILSSSGSSLPIPSFRALAPGLQL